jgi:hypothetical protein
MWYLHAELAVLLLVSFAGGCFVGALAIRLVVRRTEPTVAQPLHDGTWTTPGSYGAVG